MLSELCFRLWAVKKHQEIEMEHPEHHPGAHEDHATAQVATVKRHDMPSHPPTDTHNEHPRSMGEMEHTDHEQMFRQRFWRCLVLSVPVLLFISRIELWFGFRIP